MPIDYDLILKQIQAQQDKANQANLQRYQELLGSIDTLGQQVGSEGTFGQITSLLNTVGESARTRIGQQAQQAQASSEQDLISRGLGQTSVRESVKGGIRGQEEQAYQSAAEGVAQQRASALSGLAQTQMGIGQMKASAIEGRYDTGPDLSMYASLMQAANAAPTQQQRTVRIPGSPGTGSVTRWQAEQAAGGGLQPQQPSGGVSTGEQLMTGGSAASFGPSGTSPQNYMMPDALRQAAAMSQVFPGGGGQDGAAVPEGAVQFTPGGEAGGGSQAAATPGESQPISGVTDWNKFASDATKGGGKTEESFKAWLQKTYRTSDVAMFDKKYPRVRSNYFSSAVKDQG